MSVSSILQRNLLALSANHPHLGELISRTDPDPAVVFLTARSGALVPALHGGGRSAAMHSLIDPIREGQRLHASYQGAGYLVFLGFGAGYQILPFLGRSEVSRIIIIEKRPPHLRALLEHIDLREILLDPRVCFLVDRNPDQIKEFILSDYLPAIYGDMKGVPLRPSVEAEQHYYKRLLTTIHEVIGMVADDYTVQAQFGKKWFVNTLANLPKVEESTVTVKPVQRAFITGAGPSLEPQIEQLRKLRDSGFLIASDTSLPALLCYGLKPDLVLSIDCQLVSYHHFLKGLPGGVPLLLDLASPPVLTRLPGKISFFASNHPLSLYLSAHWRPLPFIDTSGGNVSHAAVSLAQYLGAGEIYLLGTDFSYPEGKAYARATYLFPLFRSFESRLDPLENLFLSFILKNKNIIKERNQEQLRYTTKPLIGYKQRLEVYLRETEARVIPLPGKGVPLNLESRHGKSGIRHGRIFAAGAPKMSWKSFLRQYRKGLEAIPAPSCPVSKYLFDLPFEQRSLWTTLYPAAAAFREHDPTDERREHLLLRRVRDWSLSVISRFLDR